MLYVAEQPPYCDLLRLIPLSPRFVGKASSAAAEAEEEVCWALVQKRDEMVMRVVVVE